MKRISFNFKTYLKILWCMTVVIPLMPNVSLASEECPPVVLYDEKNAQKYIQNLVQYMQKVKDEYLLCKTEDAIENFSKMKKSRFEQWFFQYPYIKHMKFNSALDISIILEKTLADEKVPMDVWMEMLNAGVEAVNEGAFTFADIALENPSILTEGASNNKKNINVEQQLSILNTLIKVGNLGHMNAKVITHGFFLNYYTDAILELNSNKFYKFLMRTMAAKHKDMEQKRALKNLEILSKARFLNATEKLLRHYTFLKDTEGINLYSYRAVNQKALILDAYLNTARLLEKENIEEAYQVYEEIINLFFKNQYYLTARKFLDEDISFQRAMYFSVLLNQVRIGILLNNPKYTKDIEIKLNYMIKFIRYAPVSLIGYIYYNMGLYKYLYKSAPESRKSFIIAIEYLSKYFPQFAKIAIFNIRAIDK